MESIRIYLQKGLDEVSVVRTYGQPEIFEEEAFWRVKEGIMLVCRFYRWYLRSTAEENDSQYLVEISRSLEKNHGSNIYREDCS